ncbi:MAG: hypothetical protein ACTSRU_05420 [Candidatus Hodarchaeales archaeon]
MSGPYIVLCPSCGYIGMSSHHSNIISRLGNMIKSDDDFDDKLNNFCFQCGDDELFQMEI